MGSRKKHRNREDEYYTDNSERGFNNPFGLDFNSLSSLFGNIDQNQLMSMMQMISQNGVNMDNMNNSSMFNGNSNQNSGFNNSMNNSNMNNSNIKQNNEFSNINKNFSDNNKMDSLNKNEELDTNTLINKLMGSGNIGFSREDENIYEDINMKQDIKHSTTNKVSEDDPNIEMLLAIRKIVNKERVRFIDKTIQLYINGVFGEF